MPTFRAGPIPVYITCAVAALGALAGCAASRLSSEPPPGVRLAGNWKLDSSRSDDLGKAIQTLDEQSKQARRSRHGGQADSGTGPGESEGPQRGRRGAATGQPRDQQGAQAGQGEGPGLGPAPHISAVDELKSNVPQGDYLGIAVAADSFTVTSGASSDEYTPGLESEISAEQGDARQISGWKGSAYVIETQPQWGPEIIQSYGLSKDGRLTMTVRLSGGKTHFTFTRIYDHTNSAPPLAPPTLN